MKNVLIFLILVFGAESVSSHTLELSEITITPSAPTTQDAVNVQVGFFGGPFVKTHSHSVVGNLVKVNMVQDGLDLAPNPPHIFVEEVDSLPEGSYEFTIEVKAFYHNETHVFTESFDVSVSPSLYSIPSGSVVSILALIAFIGLIASRTQITRRSSTFRQQAGSTGPGSARPLN